MYIGQRLEEAYAIKDMKKLYYYKRFKKAHGTQMANNNLQKRGGEVYLLGEDA